jgi:hypothetical protein
VSLHSRICLLLSVAVLVGCTDKGHAAPSQRLFGEPCVVEDSSRRVIAEYYTSGRDPNSAWSLLMLSPDCGANYACAVPYSSQEIEAHTLIYGPRDTGEWPPPEGDNGICVVTCLEHSNCDGVVFVGGEGDNDDPGVCCPAINMGEGLEDDLGACVEKTGEAVSPCPWKIGEYLITIPP